MTSTTEPQERINIHPGEILNEEFIVPLDITQHSLAIAIGVPPRRINKIVHWKRGIATATALRLGRYFSTTAQFWLNLQRDFDIERTRADHGDLIDAITPLASA